ncbi:MAG: D-tyrosyl-tRNA(Tyr) deacylase [Fibrella sp.]|nr:D-tyrosyl-tRNA(Tyr) deacylase [Armatimonadota bacterium]
MRAVLQRVSSASVTVADTVVGEIQAGLVVLIGVEAGDTDTDVSYIVGKVADLRLFPEVEHDETGMERSLHETGGSALVISQFTLLGDCRKGRRPSWSGAARPEEAVQYYEAVVHGLRERGIRVATGVFRAHMHVSLINDGPVTVLLDSKKAF